MQRLIGMLSSVEERASGEKKASVIRSPSPIAQRLIQQLLVTLDEDAVLAKREGVCEKFDELDGEAETLADDDIGHARAAEDVKSELAEYRVYPRIPLPSRTDFRVGGTSGAISLQVHAVPPSDIHRVPYEVDMLFTTTPEQHLSVIMNLYSLRMS
eukprot:g8290.t1